MVWAFGVGESTIRYKGQHLVRTFQLQMTNCSFFSFSELELVAFVGGFCFPCIWEGKRFWDQRPQKVTAYEAVCKMRLLLTFAGRGRAADCMSLLDAAVLCRGGGGGVAATAQLPLNKTCWMFAAFCLWLGLSLHVWTCATVTHFAASWPRRHAAGRGRPPAAWPWMHSVSKGRRRWCSLPFSPLCMAPSVLLACTQVQ